MAIAGVMSRFRLRELSGVDRPAQPLARVAIMKRDDSDPYEAFLKRKFSDTERKHLAETGAAMEGGEYPIVTEEDLHNAVRAFGRAKNPAKTKAHIISRARSMGMTSALPQDWTSKGVTMTTTAELNKSLGLGENASETDRLNALIAKANKAEADRDKAEKEKEDAEKKAEKEKEDAEKKAEKALRKASMTAAEQEHTSGMSDDDADDFMSKPVAERKKAMAKALAEDETVEIDGQTIRKSRVDPGLFAILQKQSKQLAENTAAIAKAAEANATVAFTKEASEDLKFVKGTLDERVAMLKGINAIPDPIARKAARDTLTLANTLAKAGFDRIGTGGGGMAPNGDGSAQAAIETATKDYQKTHPTLSFAKAQEAVLMENPDLYQRAEEERRARIARVRDAQ